MSATRSGSGTILGLLVPLNNLNAVSYLEKKMFWGNIKAALLLFLVTRGQRNKLKTTTKTLSMLNWDNRVN